MRDTIFNKKKTIIKRVQVNSRGHERIWRKNLSFFYEDVLEKINK